MKNPDPERELEAVLRAIDEIGGDMIVETAEAALSKALCLRESIDLARRYKRIQKAAKDEAVRRPMAESVTQTSAPAAKKRKA